MYIYIGGEQEKEKLKKEESCRTLRQLETEKGKNITESFLVPNS